MAGDERIRLFCGFVVPRPEAERLSAWAEAELGRGGRVVPPDNIHVTLAFLGSRPRDDLAGVVAALRDAVAGVEDVRFRVLRYRETRSVAMLVLDDEDGRGGRVAGRLQASLEELGVYRREARAWLPHVTVLRFRERPGLRPRLPELGEIVPSGAAAYLSRLGPGGSRYEVLESVALGGR